VNQEALDDPNYKIYTEPSELPLYNVMTQNAEAPVAVSVAFASSTQIPTETVDPLVQEQINDLMSWTVYNINKVQDFQRYPLTNGIPPWVNTVTPINPLGVGPYTGVIMNPRQCEVEEIFTDLTETHQQLNEVFNNPIYAPIVGNDKNVWEAPNSGADALEEVADDAALDELLEHNDRVLSNMPSIMGLIQAALGLASALSLLSNPCSPLADFMGSLMDKGKKMVADIKAQIGEIKATISGYVQSVKDVANGIIGSVKQQIGPIIADVKAIAADVKNMAKDVAKMVADEVKNIAKSLLAQARQGLAALLANLPDDPCLRSLGTSVLTGAAAALL
jgi:hypothetical protein